jgi:hypothetical protein
MERKKTKNEFYFYFKEILWNRLISYIFNLDINQEKLKHSLYKYQEVIDNFSYFVSSKLYIIFLYYWKFLKSLFKNSSISLTNKKKRLKWSYIKS